MAMKLGETVEARGHFEAALAACRAPGLRWMILSGIGTCHFYEGRLEDAYATYLEARPPDGADDVVLGFLLGNGALVLQELGRFDEAEQSLHESRRVYERVGDRRGCAVVTGFAAGLLHERGDLAGAQRGYEDALEMLRGAASPDFEGLFGGALGAVLAALDRVADSGRTFAAARVALVRMAVGPLLASLEVHLGHLDLAHGRACARAGDTRAAERHEKSARRRLADAFALERPGDDVRFARRILERAFRESEARVVPGDKERVVLSADARWCRVGAGEIISLKRRRQQRQLLLALVRKRVEAPGRAMTIGELLREAWPGERFVRDTGRGRVHTAVKRLRKLGLRDVLLEDGEGYVLDPDAVEIAER
jgi:tetratricopeptide (TPR) repeat protein